VGSHEILQYFERRLSGTAVVDAVEVCSQIQRHRSILAPRLTRRKPSPSEHLWLESSPGNWIELPPLIHARAAPAAAVVGDKLVVVGRQNAEQLVAQTEVFGGSSWKDAANMPKWWQQSATRSTSSTASTARRMKAPSPPSRPSISPSAAAEEVLHSKCVPVELPSDTLELANPASAGEI
jgi:hypothetical protein